MAAINDFSRLWSGLPPRHSETEKRLARRNTAKFFEETHKDEFEWPKIEEIENGVKFHISTLIDKAVLNVYNEAIHVIQTTTEHVSNFRTLCKAKPVCGGFRQETAILENATPFEQMVAFDHFLDARAANWLKGRRTFCFKKDDENVIPIYVASRTNADATTMTTVIGTSRGKNKCPKYSQLADDRVLVDQSPLLKSLEALEIVRQPEFSGATVLKGTAFEAGTISHNWRYRVERGPGQPSQYACVELTGQKQRVVAPIKERSAGCNILGLMRQCPDRDITKTFNFEDWSNDGYNDDAAHTVEVKDVWKGVEQAVVQDDLEQLIDPMRKLFVAKVGPFTSPVVKEFYCEKIFNASAV